MARPTEVALLKRPLRLRSHLILLVLAAVLPLLLFTGILIRQSITDQRRAVQDGILDTVRALSLAVDREIAIAQGILETLAGAQSLDRGDLQAFYQIARQAAVKRAGARIVLFDPSGQQRINTFRDYGTPLPNLFRDTGPIGKDPDFPDLMLGLANTVKQVMQSGRAAVSDVFVGLINGRPTVTIDVPVIRDGKVRYVVNMAFEADAFTKLLTEQRLPAGWVAGIFDRRGINFGRTMAAEKFVGRPASRELLEQIAKNQQGFGEGRTHEGAALYHAFVRSPVTGWVTAAEVPQQQANAASRQPIFFLVSGGAALLLLGLGMALFFGRRLAQSIGRLAQADEVTRENGSVEAQPSRVYEIEAVRLELSRARALARAAADERERRIAAEARKEEAEAAREFIAESEARVRVSEERLARSHRAARVGTWDWNLVTGQSTWTDETWAVFGQEPGSFQVNYQNWLACVHPEDRAAAVAAVDQARHNRTYSHEFRVIAADGSVRWLSSRGEFVYDESGLPLRMIGTVLDATARKEMEVSLRDSEECFRVLLGGIKDHAIFMLDAAGRIGTWNAGAEQLTGFTDAEAIGQVTEILYQPSDRASGKPVRDLQAAAAAAENAPYERDGCLVRKDGTKFHGNITIATLSSNSGDVRGYACVIRDITKRKQSEEALRQAGVELRRDADELERFNRLMVGRELRMIELKKEVNELCGQRGQAARYSLNFEDLGNGRLRAESEGGES